MVSQTEIAGFLADLTSWAPLLPQTENLPSGSGGALFRLSGPNNRIPCTNRPSKTQIALFGSKRPLFRVSASRWRIYRPKDRRLVVAKTGLNVIGVCMTCDSDNKKDRPPVGERSAHFRLVRFSLFRRFRSRRGLGLYRCRIPFRTCRTFSQAST